MPHTVRQHLLRLVALVACAFAAPAMAEECKEEKCFGIDWKTATIAEIENIDVNARDENGLTPLHKAASWNFNSNVIETLLKRGANVNSRNENGVTPLFNTATRGNYKATEILIRHGADVNARNKDGRTPLHWAAFSPILRKEGIYQVAETLIRYGADANARDKDGNTPLFSAWGGQMAELLISNAVIVNIRNKNGSTPLHSIGSGEAAEVLIRYGADVNAKDKWDRTPLHSAVYSNANMAETLILNGSFINAKDIKGETPLHYVAGRSSWNIEAIGDKDIVSAVIKSTEDFVKLLLKHGADASIKNNDGKTALVLGKEDKYFYRSNAYWLLNDATYN